ncbi:MAG: hypothetical protein HY038_05700 [Nitrospirae bacterium]|nr:hypothetical protein [Nitrospirota bacterium]
MLKITEQRAKATDSITLILEGRLAGPWVDELDAYWREMSPNHQSCALIDLTGVTFIDANGKALLTRLWQRGAELRAAGCLTRCIVEEITNGRHADTSRSSREDRRKGR